MYRRITFLVSCALAAMVAMPTQAASADEKQGQYTPSAPAVAAEQIVVFGVVVPGAETGCVMLQDFTGTTLYDITYNDIPLPQPGTWAIVRGQVRLDWGGICQQGLPLEIFAVKPIGVDS